MTRASLDLLARIAAYGHPRDPRRAKIVEAERLARGVGREELGALHASATKPATKPSREIAFARELDDATDAAGLFVHYEPFMKAHAMTREMNIEVTVALVTITLFIPCIANFFMILKERGWRTGVAMMAFIVPFSFGVGALVNQLMRTFH